MAIFRWTVRKVASLPIRQASLYLVVLTLVLVAVFYPGKASAQTLQQSGAVGIEGTVPSNPPTQAASITVPSNGQVFSSIPINVSGLCPKGLLVEIFKNGVFAGSDQCDNGSFSLQIDLFEGKNDLVAKVFDSLNQSGPDSSTVSVTFNSGASASGPRVSLITAYAKRGATPGSTLTWPLTLSGGRAPYAISVDWGDKTPAELLSRADAGDFTIDHIYGAAGVYKVIIKVSDAGGDSAFLQVVGVGNGPIQQTAQANGAGKTQKVVLWWPFLITLALIIVAFWVGQKHQLEVIRDRLRRGERPFK